jgi:acyl-CoA thioesterase
MNKQAPAERIAKVIEHEDRASGLLSIRLLEVRPGHVRMAMRVTERMVNTQQVCHGGLIFALADSSFGYASNSHGDELTAEAQESADAGRTRVYDVRVTNQREELLALFRGKSTTVKGASVE